MNKFKVSIIINTYNGERYVSGIISTLKPYESPDIEYVLVDDGSEKTDTTVEKFKAAFPSAVIIQEENEGLAEARNKGAAVAKGEYLQFIDIDDSISSDKILAQYNFAKEKNIDVVYSDWRMMIVDGQNQESPEPWVKSNIQDDILASLLEGWWNPFHSYLIKTEVYHSVGGGNKELVNAQDFDLMVRIAAESYSFAYLEGNYSEYYRYESVKSLARGDRKQYWRDNEYTVLNTIEIIKQKEKEISKLYIDAACNRLFYIARNVYKIDKAWNKRIIGNIFQLSINFVPTNQSKSFLFLYKLIGYHNTERLLSKFK